MPLDVIDAGRAVENRKGNPLGHWESRLQPNRVEPICLPGFDAPFEFVPGEAIFTVGSCFARNVEDALLKHGFELPMRDVLNDPAIAKFDPLALNNYGSPSIYNEFAWAFGAEAYDPQDHFIEVGQDRWVDLHLPALVRPGPLEDVKARREAITRAYRSAAKCRVIIMTLGFVELWYDKQTRSYLNITPRPVVLREHGDRFELHVLSFEEAYGYLERALTILRDHCHPDVRVILTVSPVPLAVTHRSDDVIVANSYSKSVLRAAAETARMRFPFITYFPSFESVTLSDREVAWQDDQQHVTQRIVSINVGRMVERFAGAGAEPDGAPDVDAEIEGPAAAAALARDARARGGDFADAFFERTVPVFGTDARFAASAIEHALERSDAPRAAALIEGLSNEDAETGAIRLLRFRTLFMLGRAAEALALAERSMELDGITPVWLQSMLSAGMRANDADALQRVLALYATTFPNRLGDTYVGIGHWHMRNGRTDEAAGQFETALAMDGTDAGGHLGLAEVALARGDIAGARAALAKARPGRPFEIAIADRLRAALGAGE